MIIFKTIISVLIFSSILSAKSLVLSPENFSSATLTVAFDRTIKLSKKNKFRFPVMIDPNNRCTLSSTRPTIIRTGTEWKTESRSEWDDWDLKRFSFRLTNRDRSVFLNCDLNLNGEILLFNSDTKRKANKECKRLGGRPQKIPPSTLTRVKMVKSSRLPASTLNTQTYCVKRIPKLKSNQFKNAFAKSNISIQIDFRLDSIGTEPTGISL